MTVRADEVVSRIMARYGGVIERAIRTSTAASSESDELFEVHVLIRARTFTTHIGMTLNDMSRR